MLNSGPVRVSSEATEGNALKSEPKNNETNNQRVGLSHSPDARAHQSTLNVAKHNHNMVETCVETASNRIGILSGRNKPIVIPIDCRFPRRGKGFDCRILNWETRCY